MTEIAVHTVKVAGPTLLPRPHVPPAGTPGGGARPLGVVEFTTDPATTVAVAGASEDGGGGINVVVVVVVVLPSALVCVTLDTLGAPAVAIPTPGSDGATAAGVGVMLVLACRISPDAE